MRGLGTRLNLLRKLINVQCGPGAAILPDEVTRVHMDFATTLKGGHMGARKFWRENLPRLKYHNPAIPMIVNRHAQNEQPPVMSIYMRKPGAAPSTESRSQAASSRTGLSKAPTPDADETVVHIYMKDKHSSHILEFFLAEARAVPIQATKEEIEEMQELSVMRKQADVDRERVRRIREEKKREEDMLKRARAAGGMAEEEEAS